MKPSPERRPCAEGEGALSFPHSKAKPQRHHRCRTRSIPKTSLRCPAPAVYETADSPERAVCEADRNHSLCGIRSLTVRSPKGKFQAPRRGNDFEANAERGGGSFFASFLSLHQRKKRRSGMTNPIRGKSKVLGLGPPGPCNQRKSKHRLPYSEAKTKNGIEDAEPAPSQGQA